ncbi:50S ribosomal protein L5 [Patescibacteria group bacterium]|nr:50S ribosomal protein L5 [Patescibacteria group bacterium]MBU1673656.1 50S ribosomal protein L5 [Patescibacteria group bacterium]MBU1963856.1 50S ribosomal protein L5 [Patescibacteria group bacterium]
MNRLREKYNKEIKPALKEKFGYKNDLAVPRLEKVTVNIGLGKSLEDANFTETAVNTLTRITGQKPVLTRARKSISNFKIREGMAVGAKVTLRNDRMYEFLDKLMNVALPRVRDFRGISKKTVDQQGNMNIGFTEHIVFPEIQSDEVEKIHGLEVAMTTSAHNKEEGLALFEAMGMPFKQDNK